MAIDKAVFDDQLAKLREETTIVEMDLHQLKLEQLDIEAALSFSQYVIFNAPRLWVEASLDQKQRLQKALFPEGIQFSEGRFETGKCCLLFNMFGASNGEKANMACPTGFELVFDACRKGFPRISKGTFSQRPSTRHVYTESEQDH